MARFCHQAGAVIVGIAERDGAIVSATGFDPEQVHQHRRASKTIMDYPSGERLENPGDALTLECDVLIPPALENQLTADNAADVKARIILEGANGPTTPEADAIFGERGLLVIVIPDVYANAGGVIVSYFEWLKNLSHVRFGRLERRYQVHADNRLLQAIETATGKRLTAAERGMIVQPVDELTVVNSGLEETMVVAYHAIRDQCQRTDGVDDLRTAAYLELGIFP